MLKRLLAAAALALAVGAPPSLAQQYRAGEPPTLPPPPQADPDAPANATLNQFAEWNAASGRPRILIFWNRELTDETSTLEDRRFVETETRRNGRTVTEDSTNTQFGNAFRSDDDSVSERRLERGETSKVTTGGKYAALDRVTSRVLEDTFVNMFLAAGASIADRDALIRKISLDMPKSERLDLQYLEAKVLNENVAYLVEVLPDVEPSAPTGLIYSVTIRHVPSSSIMAKFMTSGEVASGAPRFVATSSGFQKVIDDRNTPERVAAQVAIATMDRFNTLPRAR